MQELASDFIGLPLLTRSGERIGYVKNVQTDKNLRRLRNLECCDDEEEEFVLPLSAAESFGKDALVIKSVNASGCKNCRSAPFGAIVYSKQGVKLGTVSDFSRSGTQITALVLSDKTQIDAERIVSVTDAVMADLSENFTPRASRPRTRKKPADGTDSDTAASAQCPARADASAQAEAQAETEPSGETEPQAETAAVNPEFSRTSGANEPSGDAERTACGKRAGRGLLTGKILPNDLFDARGNAIARAGSAVTADVIRRAMQHNKLFELTLLCCGSPTSR